MRDVDIIIALLVERFEFTGDVNDNVGLNPLHLKRYYLLFGLIISR